MPTVGHQLDPDAYLYTDFVLELASFNAFKLMAADRMAKCLLKWETNTRTKVNID